MGKGEGVGKRLSANATATPARSTATHVSHRHEYEEHQFCSTSAQRRHGMAQPILEDAADDDGLGCPILCDPERFPRRRRRSQACADSGEARVVMVWSGKDWRVGRTLQKSG